MTSLRRIEPAFLAGLIVVWAAAWSAPFRQIVPDTKYDLVLDPWGFLGRALSLWDSQQNWGGLSNQGYGYLFPMGPFFGVLGEIVPAWTVQRLWWMTLLTVGYLGALGLLRALGVRSAAVRAVGALAWVLSPKVVSSYAVLSGEIHPHILIPLILWPVVLGWRRELSPWRAALLSAGAIVLAGGVNGAAVMLALTPTGLFLITRRRWWRSALTWLWVAGALAATGWWLASLLFMARYSAPFLDWIETSGAVSAPIGMVDVLRGTTQWLGHLVTPGGPWWPGGYQLATSGWLIVLTSIIAAAGVLGLALRSVPFRGYLWLMLALGAMAMLIPHTGPLDSPLSGAAQAALDGPLAAFRNIHKADGLVRLPLVVGVAHLLCVLRERAVIVPRTAVPLRPGVAAGVIGVIVVLSAAPAFTSSAVARGGHEQVPEYWAELGEWLDQGDRDGGVLMVPASNFGEYTWGRPIDEPLRGLTTADIVTRDAVPLVNAGSIRLLDDVERRLRSGRAVDGAVEVLRQAGIRYLVVRNDLDPTASGQPPVALARAAIRGSDGVRLVRGFGTRGVDITGERVRPLEVYELTGEVSAAVEVWPVSSTLAATGASDDLALLADAGLGSRPVIFAGDALASFIPPVSVITDGLRARERYFGAPRADDLTSTMSESAGLRARDYRPWFGPDHLSFMAYDAGVEVTASSSLATDLTLLGLHPATRPAAAFDGAERTAWLTAWDAQPTLEISLGAPQALDVIDVVPPSHAGRVPATVSPPTRVTIETDSGTVETEIAAEGSRLVLPSGETSRITLTITETAQGEPGNHVTGLAEVVIPGVPVNERLITAPAAVDRPAAAIVLSGGLAGRDSCLKDARGMRCLGFPEAQPESLAGAGYVITDSAAGLWQLRGTMHPTGSPAELVGSPHIAVEASSTRTAAAPGQASSAIDGDPRTAWSPSFTDPAPTLTLQLPTTEEISQIRVQVRGGWVDPVTLRVRVGGQEFFRGLPEDGRVVIPPTGGDQVVLEFLALDRDTVLGGMEIVDVVINDTPFPPPTDRLDAPCGSGPPVLINGQEVPTSASLDRDGWLGVGIIEWAACDDVSLGGEDDDILVGPWLGFAPHYTTLTREDLPAPKAHGERFAAGSHRSTLTTQVPASPEARLVVLTQNANTGWRAHLDGVLLEPQVVDGRRQGFIVPPGASGVLEVSFAPDRLYRTVLIGGLIVAGTVLIAALWALLGLRSRAAAPQLSPPQLRNRGWLTPWGWRAAVTAVGAVVAGPFGALVAVIALIVAARVPSSWRIALIAALLVCAAVIQAVVAPASLGPPTLEGAVRLSILAALSIAAVPIPTAQPTRHA
ncbi:MAG: alpha-(1-_3)-arabinofuranosyltransferase family protein [Actinomycetia bacterium]|nr:alpha-(1->3)-arabinofuranosyltransferase family protein [Actinomycetes bacterium]